MNNDTTKLYDISDKYGNVWTGALHFSALKLYPEKLSSSYVGCVYAFELDGRLKIGRSQQPQKRITQIITDASSYFGITSGRICVSPPHTNWTPNETLLHKHFALVRHNRELFNLTLDEFFEQLPDLAFEDRSIELAQETQATFEALKDFTTGRTQGIVVRRKPQEQVIEPEYDWITAPEQHGLTQEQAQARFDAMERDLADTTKLISIPDYLKRHNAVVSMNEIMIAEKWALSHSRCFGYITGSTPDAYLGNTITYHENVLNQAFGF